MKDFKEGLEEFLGVKFRLESERILKGHPRLGDTYTLSFKSEKKTCKTYETLLSGIPQFEFSNTESKLGMIVIVAMECWEFRLDASTKNIEGRGLQRQVARKDINDCPSHPKRIKK